MRQSPKAGMLRSNAAGNMMCRPSKEQSRNCACQPTPGAGIQSVSPSAREDISQMRIPSLQSSCDWQAL
eukprot:334306-Pelagomonas_calceolata.AAC.3